MALSVKPLLRGTIWTTIAYGLGQVLRLGTNVVLARLLSPEVFGIMLIVYSFRTGIELLSDVGLSQSVIYERDAEDPQFYNTAWSLQLIRGILLWIIFTAAAIPLADFYSSPILLWVIPITAFNIVLASLTSVQKTLLQKRLLIVKLNAFELAVQFASAVAHILWALFNPTVWALVFGGLFGSVVQMVGSYFLLPGVNQRFYLSGPVVSKILRFGKWIFFSSMVYFLSTYVDRFYFPKVVPLEIFGIYGIARSISDLSGNLVLRLGNVVLFPFIAAHFQMPRAELRQQIAKIRVRFLLLAGFGFSFFVATGDLAIKLLYDERYHAATWILPILTIGSWFSVLTTLNEYKLLGLGKPSYAGLANLIKLLFLVIGLPLSAKFYGLVGGVVVVALSDLCRYIPLLVGQFRERFSFARQDLFVTLAMLLMVLAWEWFRSELGLGTSFDSLPTEVRTFFSIYR
jgi:O-antigen/teichoic acid export membrane protein